MNMLIVAPLLTVLFFRPLPDVLSDLKAAIDKAGAAATAIESAEAQIPGVIQELKANGDATKRHNAVWPDGVCKYQKSAAECQPWIDEAETLNTEKSRIVATGDALDASIQENKRRFQIAMMQIRVLNAIGALEAWYKGDVMPCTGMAPSAAKGCLDRAWERHP